MAASVTTVVGTGSVPVAVTGGSFIEWAPVMAGAVGAAAIAFVLLTFGSAVGLSLASPWPGSGASSTTMLILGVIWTLAVNVLAFAAGGYIAGRLRSSWGDPNKSEHEFRDGAHGFVVWAVAVLFGGLLAASAVAGAARTTTQAAATVASGAAAGGGAAAAANLAGGEPLAAVDLLLRPADVAPGAAAPAPRPVPVDNDEMLRAETGRIIVAGLRDGTLPTRERTYLAQIVSARTGMPQADAERRVDAAFAEAKAAEMKAREAADKARKAGAVAAFLAAAALALGCVAACAGASLGGRHRDQRGTLRFFGASRFW
jgi:hypothetical protein